MELEPHDFFKGGVIGLRKKLLALCLTAVMLTAAGCDEVAGEQSEPTVAAQQARAFEKFPSFTSKALDGSTVTENIFVGKKLTVVNIWGTFCPPCIAEMPELGRWAAEMPEDVQLIGLVCDVRSENDEPAINAAKKILSESNANFINIIPSAGLIDYLSTVEAVPTTIFVDGDGKIVGAPIIGADVDAYKNFVDAYVNN